MTVEICPSNGSLNDKTTTFIENEENVSPLSAKHVIVLLKSKKMYDDVNTQKDIQDDMLLSTPAKYVTSTASNTDNLIKYLSSTPVKRSSSNSQLNNSQLEPSPKKPTTPNVSKNYLSSKILSHSASACKFKTFEAKKRIRANLSQSCFADIRTNKVDDGDGDLTCLNWLQEGNLLKGFSPARKSNDEVIESPKVKVEENEQSDLQLDSTDPLNLSIATEVEKLSRKPPYSFSALIFMAIESTENKCMAVKDIYKWIQDNFPYFQTAPPGWKNSIRHNLSLNKSFRKDTKKKCLGKGSLWTIDHEARAGLVQQLRKANIYNSYPFFKTSFTRNLFREKNNIYKRDAAGRFLRYHDDKEFDVAATMCSLSAPTVSKHYEQKTRTIGKIDQAINVNLLKIWRTYFEPFESSNHRKRVSPKPEYSMSNFIAVVKSKLMFQDSTPTISSLNSSYEEEYDFGSSDESSDSEDDEISENMKRLVEQECDDNDLCDSGYAEKGTFKSAAMLDHSYSKKFKGNEQKTTPVDGLLYLANAASQELEKIRNDETSKPL